MKRRYVLAAMLSGLIFISFAVTPRPTQAANYSVMTAEDLAAAITSANADPASDTILLTADIVISSAAETSADYGNTGLPAITSDITIEGQGHSIFRSSISDFRMLRLASTGSLTIYNVTLGGGKATSGTTANGCGSGITCGGAVFSEGTITLTHSMILSNSARDGAGLYVLSGTANIYDSVFTQNSGDSNAGHGGGIYVKTGNLTVRDSIFSDNQSATGGGIYFAAGVEVIDRTTFANNKVSFAGGGLVSANGSGTITASTFSNNLADLGGGLALTGNTQVRNSTFSGNKATSGGGGGYFDALNRSVAFINVTFSGNTAPVGGGIYSTNTQSLSFQNSLIVQSGAGGNCTISGGTLTADVADLADDASCSGFTNIASPPQNLNIGSFADNGGSTKTFAISAPSPALDNATGLCSGFDQRGIARGINTVGAVNSPRTGDCDIGAFEAGGSVRTLQFATPASSIHVGTVNTVQVPLKLDSTLYQADTVKAYLWISGGTAVAGVDYAPFGMQTVSIAPGSELATANITLLNPAATTDKTIVVSFAMQNGPGFSGAIRLGPQLTHTVTLIASDANTGVGQNYSVATANDLVAAITAANTTNGTDTIFLTSDITLTAKADTSPDYGDSGLPAVTSHIRIEGHGHSITRSAVGGTPNFRILRVAPDGILTLDNLTISGGKTSSNGFHFGGGIFSEGTVTLNNSLIAANNADYGGGLGLQYGTVNIYDSTVSNNSAANYGAGIVVLAGNIGIIDSVVSNNTSVANGGGIYVDQGSIAIDRSTINSNTAGNLGGGLIFGYSTGSAIITNSTFSGNSAKSGGGAALAGSVYLSNSTFSGNTATQTGGGALLSVYQVPMTVRNITFMGNTAPSGGGIYVDDPGALVSITDSIIAQSTAGGNCFFGNGTLPASSGNLADDASCSGFTNVSAPALNIGLLADNGGSTKTYAISAPSPALDSAIGSCSGFDQRGIARGINTVGAVNSPQIGDCDVGAFEAGGVIHTLQFASDESTVVATSTSSFSVPLQLDATLAQGDNIKAYVWVSGGTAVEGVDYVPFGVQTVTIPAGSAAASARITLLNSTITSDKTIILSFATQNGPGFSGATRLGTQLTHTVTLSPQPIDAPGQTFSVSTPTELVAAIRSANGTTGVDTIFLRSDITLTSAAESNATYGATGLPAITTSIIIEGHGHSITRDSNAPDFRIMRIAASGTLTLYNLTIRGGKATNASDCTYVICGSGFYSAGALIMTHTTVTANTLASGSGLFVDSGSVELYDSTFSNNASLGKGGAIHVYTGSLNIVDSVFSGNTATIDGGGIYIDQGSETIDHSTFTGNTTSGRGGGIVSFGTATTISSSTFSNNSANKGAGINLFGNAQLSNTTFSGNTGSGTMSTGGGALFEIFYGSIVLDNLSFVGNGADMGSGIAYQQGSALFINNTIIVQSSNGENCFGGSEPFQSSGVSNLADDASCSGFTNIASPPQNLNMGSLANNGGSTKTYAISAPSPALDSAIGPCSGFDQRGTARGINTVGAVNSPQIGDCDVGAFEAGGVIHTLQFASDKSTVVATSTNSYSVPLQLDSALVQADTIKAYVWVSGGTAVEGVDYVPFGVQTVTIPAGSAAASASITLLNSTITTDKTIILSFAMQNGPGFSGPASLGTRLTHTVTLKISAANTAPTRNYFTTNTPTFTWNRVTQAVRYEIQVANNSAFSGAHIYDAGNNLSFTWPVELANDSYFWRVRACSGTTESSCGKWSALDTFTVRIP